MYDHVNVRARRLAYLRRIFQALKIALVTFLRFKRLASDAKLKFAMISASTLIE